MPLAKLLTRTDTTILSAVTPRLVAPPLPPENWTHGGEYGSPGTWAAPHPATLAGPEVDPAPPLAFAPPAPDPPPAPAVPSAPAVVPSAPISEPGTVSVAPATLASSALNSDPLPDPPAASTRTSRCWLGTRTATARKIAANPISGPYPLNNLSRAPSAISALVSSQRNRTSAHRCRVLDLVDHGCDPAPVALVALTAPSEPVSPFDAVVRG